MSKFERMQEALDSAPLGAHTFTIGTEAADVINVVIQLKNIDGQDMDERAGLSWYLSNDAEGDDLATVPTGGIAIGTDGLLVESITNSAGLVVSESDGDIDVNITDTGTPTFYFVLVNPNGKLVVSSAITFA